MGASPGSWLLRVEAAFSECLVAAPAAPNGRTLSLPPLLAAAALVKEGYSVLYSDGMIARTLRDDLQHNLDTMTSTAAAQAAQAAQAVQAGGAGGAATARGYVEAELAAAGGSPSAAKGRGGLLAVLWLSRTLRFVARMLQLLGAPDCEIAQAGKTTYDEILHPFHGPLLGWIVSAALTWAPSRKSLTDTIRANDGLDEPAAAALLARAASAMLPVTAALHDLIVEHGIDWPDKVGV